MALTDTAIRLAKAGDSDRKLADGKGLYLLITPAGSKLWRLKYRIDGREKKLGFGSYPDVSLSDARKRRDEARETLRSLQTLTAQVANGTLRVRTLSLYVLYAGGSLRTRRGMFVCDCGADGLFQHGAWQPETLPRFFKLRFEAEGGGDIPPGLPRSGVVFFLAPRHGADAQSLLATFTRKPGTRDLGLPPASAAMH